MPSTIGGPGVTPRSSSIGRTSKASASPVPLLRSRHLITTRGDDASCHVAEPIRGRCEGRFAVLYALPIPNAAPVVGADIAPAGWGFPRPGGVRGLDSARGFLVGGLGRLP